MRALGRLLRLSLAPSALADVAAGLVFASRGHWPAGAGPFWLLASSACVYHGALALNDWNDREHDARTRPGRPIPSGQVRAGTALAIGLVLSAAGPLLAWQHSAHAGLWSLALAVLALTYDFAGRGNLIGPLLLATCRAGNLGLGLFFAGGEIAQGLAAKEVAMPMLLYGFYVLRVSRLGRLEDGEDGDLRTGRPRGLLTSAALMLALLPFVPPFDSAVRAPLARGVALVLTWSAAFGLWRLAVRQGPWTRADVEVAMGMALRRLLLFTAALAALAWQPPAWDALVVSGAILAGYFVSARLRRVFPPS